MHHPNKLTLLMVMIIPLTLLLTACGNSPEPREFPPPEGYSSWDEYEAENSSDQPSTTPTRTPSKTSTPTNSPTMTLTRVPRICAGDCDGDEIVRVEELIVGINIALGIDPLATCPVFDRNADAIVKVDEIYYIGAHRDSGINLAE